MGQQFQSIGTDEKQHFHLLPGRLRLSVPGLQFNQQMAEDLAKRLAKLPGVRVGCVNPISGRALIYYEERNTDLRSLIEETFCHTRERTETTHIGKKQRIEKSLYKSKKSPKRQTSTVKKAQSVQSAVQQVIPWHMMERDKVLSCLHTTLDQGLSRNLAVQRLDRYGLNQIITGPQINIAQLFIGSIMGSMNKFLLLTAGGMLFIVGEWFDSMTILVIVVLHALAEALHSYKAERSIVKIKKVVPTANVLRQGKIKSIPASNLVPGDVIVLKAGDRVPADSRLLQAANLTTNESCLTGESLPVSKNTDVSLEHNLSTSSRRNIVFSGTYIAGGKARAVVTTTGIHTEMGKITELLNEVELKPPSLQKNLDNLTRKLSKIIGGAVGLTAAVSVIQRQPLSKILRSGVSIVVGAVPEALPAVVIVSLAAGVRRMAKKRLLVKRFSSAETLGLTTVLCVDKTGTLTRNEMTVKELYAGGKFYHVTGTGYQPAGEVIYCGNKLDKLPIDLIPALEVGVLCNNSELDRLKNKSWKITGDPSEGALLIVAAKAGLWWKDLRNKFYRQKEIAFNSVRKIMTVVCRETDGSYRVYVKGAPETILKKCTNLQQNGLIIDLDEKAYQQIISVNDEMAGRSLRVLATAWKTLPQDTDFEAIDLEKDLTFAGLAGIVDPPRIGVKRAIRKCKAAGVRVVMMTGDHDKTAQSVAQDLGILKTGDCLTGDKLEGLTDNELIREVDKVVVYSRVSSDQKLRIVRMLRQKGNIVAMVGDGFNDAPAVKEADIGVSLGVLGTDITRQSADIILEDDNFTAITGGIEEGRNVRENSAMSLRYVLSGSLGQGLAAILAALTGFSTPIVPSQLLWANVVTESMPAVSLAANSHQSSIMRRPTFKPDERALADYNKGIIRKGILTGISTFGVYAGGVSAGWSPIKARTMAFSHLVMGRIFNTFDSRRIRDNKKSTGPGKLILPSAAFSIAILMFTMYIPFIRPFFSTVPIAFTDWGLIILTSGLAGKVDSFLANSRLPVVRNNIKRSGYRFKKIHDVS